MTTRQKALRVSDLKAGDLIYEYGYGTYLPITVTEDAVHVDERLRTGWECQTVNDKTGEPLTLFEADERYAYGLDLHRRDEIDRWMEVMSQ